MTTAGKALADCVGDIFGIDPSVIFEAEIDPEEARIVRGVHGTDGRICLAYREDGEIEPARVLEVFAMQRPL